MSRWSGTPATRFAVLVGVAVLAMVIGVVAGRGIRSPEQVALDTAPPDKTVITAPVTEPTVKDSVVARGRVAVGRTVAVGPVKASTDASIVTGVFVKQGAEVKPGSRIVEVSGRPIFLLRGDFGAYRDLAVGDRGRDAAQLNAALKGLGLAAPKGDRYTDQSAAALAKLYRDAGYDPPSGDRADRRELVFVPADTASIADVATRVGARADKDPLIKVLAGKTTVTSNLDPRIARTIKRGNKATIHLEGSDAVPASVSRVTIGDTVQATPWCSSPPGRSRRPTTAPTSVSTSP